MYVTIVSTGMRNFFSRSRSCGQMLGDGDPPWPSAPHPSPSLIAGPTQPALPGISPYLEYRVHDAAEGTAPSVI